MKHKKFKKNFIIISATFIIGLIFAYTTRLITFYLQENKKNDGEKEATNYFSDVLENTINVTDTNGGLYLDGSEYIYKYDATENYLWYSGELWRILSINEDKTITMITDEAISLMQPKYGENIYVDKFLNEFYENLDKEYIVSKEYCSDKITDLKNITCEQKESKNISALDLHAYNLAGNAKGFLNDGSSYLLANTNEENNYFYVNTDGALAITGDFSYNLKAVVTIKSEINLVKGTGTKEDPYIIKDKKAETLDQTNVGDYLTFNDSLYRVISLNENSVSAIALECIKENDECITKPFGSSTRFSNSSIYRYLNTAYYETLENKEFLVKDTFYVGEYTDYNFESLKGGEFKAYIGLPKIAEYFNTKAYDSYLITPNIIETVYTMNENGNYYLVRPGNYKKIYPVLNFNKTLKLTGTGTLNDPYNLVGEVNE